GLGLNGRGLTLFQGGRSPGQDFQPDPAVGIIIPRSPKFWGELMKLIASFLRGPWQQPPPPDPNLRIEMRQPQNPTVTGPGGGGEPPVPPTFPVDPTKGANRGIFFPILPYLPFGNPLAPRCAPEQWCGT